MASWERLSTKRTGVQILPYYHMSGCDGFAKEFYDLCLSVLYAQNTNDFLFIFDMVNPVTSDYLYFQNVLKKSHLLRFLPYYPSSGFNIRGRQDLIQPITDRGPLPDRPFLYPLARALFEFQPKVREYTQNYLSSFEIPDDGNYTLGIIYDPSVPNPQSYFDKCSGLSPDQNIIIYLYCPSKSVFHEFEAIAPRKWTLKSIQTTTELHNQTNEQRIKRYYLEIAELQLLRGCPILVGCLQSPIGRLMGLLEGRFRDDPRAFRSVDGKPFRLF